MINTRPYCCTIVLLLLFTTEIILRKVSTQYNGRYFNDGIREVLVKGNSVSLRLSAITDNLIKGKVEKSHFAVGLKSAILGT